MNTLTDAQLRRLAAELGRLIDSGALGDDRDLIVYVRDLEARLFDELDRRHRGAA